MGGQGGAQSTGSVRMTPATIKLLADPIHLAGSLWCGPKSCQSPVHSTGTVMARLCSHHCARSKKGATHQHNSLLVVSPWVGAGLIATLGHTAAGHVVRLCREPPVGRPQHWHGRLEACEIARRTACARCVYHHNTQAPQPMPPLAIQPTVDSANLAIKPTRTHAHVTSRCLADRW